MKMHDEEEVHKKMYHEQMQAPSSPRSAAIEMGEHRALPQERRCTEQCCTAAAARPCPQPGDIEAQLLAPAVPHAW